VAKPRNVIVKGLGRLPQFSHASVVGDLVFAAGTLGTGPAGRLVEGGIGPETRQTLENLRAILREVGADLGDVAKVSVYLTDMADFGEMNRVYSEFFPPDPPPPARITLGVAALALGAKVEIELVARKPEG
jgi:2-iminobutanoate/2-iminopropanoate deaminase